MTALAGVHFESLSFPILIIAALLAVVVAIALCSKDHVKTGLRLPSFGFFLEANNDNTKKAEKGRTLKG